MTTCPTCSCEIAGAHKCPHTKAPTPRELDRRLTDAVARIDKLEEAWSVLDRREFAALELIANGGGLERNATPREGRCPSPAASALPPLTERPNVLEWTDRMTFGTFENYVASGRRWQNYALAIEARLKAAESEIAKLSRLLTVERASANAIMAPLVDEWNHLEETPSTCVRRVFDELKAFRCRPVPPAPEYVEQLRRDLADSRHEMARRDGEIVKLKQSLASGSSDRDALKAQIAGMVTREQAESALRECAREHLSGSSVYSDPSEYLKAALREKGGAA